VNGMLTFCHDKTSLSTPGANSCVPIAPPMQSITLDSHILFSHRIREIKRRYRALRDCEMFFRPLETGGLQLFIIMPDNEEVLNWIYENYDEAMDNKVSALTGHTSLHYIYASDLTEGPYNLDDTNDNLESV